MGACAVENVLSQNIKSTVSYCNVIKERDAKNGKKE
ncbi:Uncharacterised protein [Streptococcus pneumoniae]|nr:Uncharacterised protein [Streptococcus pneumoniae]